jgi:predicted AlkP superfamily pyrophosphatase or phosphodiesterase
MLTTTTGIGLGNHLAATPDGGTSYDRRCRIIFSHEEVPLMSFTSAVVGSGRRTLVLGAVIAAASACATAQGIPREGQAGRPSLVVFITIDQMRADYLERFGGQLTGGLQRLMTGGALFRNGVHDHAITETAPGHSVTMSGRFPVHTGIVMNSLGVNDVPNAQVLGARPGESASPERFNGTTLTDWLRTANRATKWLSVSRKDRGAILPIGKSKGDVYWYSPSGEFTTSKYYADSLPTWVQAFNALRIPQSYAGKKWELLKNAASYSEADTVGIEANSVGGDVTFPHSAPTVPAQAAASFAAFPWMDELTLRLAVTGMRTLKLGADPGRTDVLAVSLSTLDAIGHRFGPDSREVHDQVLRLDQYLGAFLDSLEAIRGVGTFVVALTSDHGTSPPPTLKSAIYPNGDAKRVSLEMPWRAFQQRLVDAGIDSSSFAIDDGLVIVMKPGTFGGVRGGADGLLGGLARDFMRMQGVLRVDLMTNLAKADTVNDTIARRWLHMFSPQSNVRLIATLTPYSYWLPVAYSTHGSPHDSDAYVPVIFWGAGVVPGQYTNAVRVVDMAPTLAAILGVKPTEALDGRVLTQVIR